MECRPCYQISTGSYQSIAILLITMLLSLARGLSNIVSGQAPEGSKGSSSSGSISDHWVGLGMELQISLGI